jgi:hypothetical protein
VLCVGVAPRREGAAALPVFAATRACVAVADVAAPTPRAALLDTHGATGARCAAMTEHGEFILGAPLLARAAARARLRKRPR